VAGSAAKREKRDRRFIFVKFTMQPYPPLAVIFAYTDVLSYLTGKDVCRGNFFWARAVAQFLGQSPDWYKLILLVFLVVNPIIFSVNPFIAGWLLVAEFIFTLAMALKCYPLLPGGLLAFEAVVIGMTSAEHVKAELASNLEVLLLLMFMVAGIYFMKQLLLFIFTRLLLSIPSKTFSRWRFALRPPSCRPSWMR
jgi:Na+/H+ antiporter NhaB